MTGQMNIGGLVAFIAYTMFIGGAIGSLGNFYAQIVSAIGGTERIMEILNMDSEVTLDERSGETIDNMVGDLQFENVQFSYPTRDDIPVLKGIDIDIKAGQKIALVGSSGAGKSTIAQLILRFYPLKNGKIKIDGKNIFDLDIQDYRKYVGVVPQEVLLFGGTIRENIAYGKPGASENEIIEAAKKSNSWEFISSFPEGLDTVVGERGVKLSGGQRQRVAIARAILRNPSILILDEATSALDSESEKVVQDALDNLMEGRTSVIIAHRLSTIRDVDCIYVLDDGKVIEKGNHNELSAIEDGAYNAFAKLQFENQ
jgi:ABC-type multidrug transport system fused ATPase/permease subunit